MISKVKDVMNDNNNKQLAYKVWLDELNTAPSDAFFPTFRQFLELLIKENPTKIDLLKEKIDKETKTLVASANKAIKELEPLLDSIESTLKDKTESDLTQIEHYKQAKSGKLRIIGEDLPDTLYHAIRLTVERHKNNGLLNKFDDRLLSVRDNFWYLDYAKTTEVYPSYKNYKDTKEEFERKQKEEPWGAYAYLEWAKTFFKDVLPEQAGSFVKTDIINNLRRLILYLLIPPDDVQNKAKKVIYKITYTKTREILLNEALRLAKPDFDSENEVVFDYLYKNPNKKITKDQMERELRIKIAKSFHKIVENLGFKGDLKRVFFQVSKTSIYFRNPITEDDLEAPGIGKIKLP